MEMGPPKRRCEAGQKWPLSVYLEAKPRRWEDSLARDSATDPSPGLGCGLITATRGDSEVEQIINEARALGPYYC